MKAYHAGEPINEAIAQTRTERQGSRRVSKRAYASLKQQTDDPDLCPTDGRAWRVEADQASTKVARHLAGLGVGCIPKSASGGVALVPGVAIKHFAGHFCFSDVLLLDIKVGIVIGGVDEVQHGERAHLGSRSSSGGIKGGNGRLARLNRRAHASQSPAGGYMAVYEMCVAVEGEPSVYQRVLSFRVLVSHKDAGQDEPVQVSVRVLQAILRNYSDRSGCCAERQDQQGLRWHVRARHRVRALSTPKEVLGMVGRSGHLTHGAPVVAAGSRWCAT